jgi:hemolysin activation/secretion protein
MNFLCRNGAGFYLLALLLVFSASLAIAQDNALQFRVDGYLVEGNTLISPDDIHRVLAPYVGEGCDFGTIQQALEALQATYRQRGFLTVLVQLPEQELKNGKVRLIVTEQKIATVTLEGNQFFTDTNIRSSVPALQENMVPDLDQISASLRVANENPAKQTRLSLESGTTANHINAHLKVLDRKPWQLGATLDDTGNDETGDLRVSLRFSHANLFNADHLLTLQYQTSPKQPQDVTILSLGYRMPLYSWGDSVDLYAAYTDVDSGTISAGRVDLDVAGKGQLFGLHYNLNLKRYGNYEHHLIWGADYRAFENDVTLDDTPLGADICVHPLSLTYAGKWQSSVATQFHLTLVQNIPGGSNGSDADFDKARAGASADYRLFKVSAESHIWFGKESRLRLRAHGQYSNEPLVSGEGFGLGGADSVRGFNEREVADDRGFFASAEFYLPDLVNLFDKSAARLQPLVFYDAGWLERIDSLPGETSHRDIACFGAGLRMAMGEKLNARLDYAYLVDGNETRSAGDSRWHFALNFVY